jgi:pimeloyl-ACP methyl ester carboxylesterase
VNPILYRAAEAIACWSRISAPTLWMEGAASQPEIWWGGRYTKAEFHQRLSVVPQVERHVVADAGHMIQHDQPGVVAEALARFLA